jgi:CDP-glycerol glycerophosphotransferase
VNTPRISVVVPFYNNADVLGDCLASIAAQTFRDLEVIMVDDGSTDAGAAVARARAAADPRFTLIQVPNGGPGRARNLGVERATGEFLAFVDGDDLLPPHAYETQLHTLESSGSDFVCGAVQRIGTNGVHPSALHERAIKGRKIGTHVTRSPELLYDISVWNKLFRKSFWDARALHYPEGMVWEDLQLMTRAHVLARAVDVIGDHIYYWRERAAGEFSITQNRADIQNLRDRVTALLAIDSFLRERAPARTARAHQRKALINDLWLYVRDLGRVSDDYLAEYLDLANRYLDTVPRRVLRSLPATHKLAYWLTRRRLDRQLLGYLGWLLDQPVTTIGVLRRFGRLSADLPFRGDRALRIPASAYRPHWRDLDPFVQVESVGWQRGNLVISGLAYVPSVDISKRRYTNKIVILRPRARFRPPIVSLATSFRHPRATVLSGQECYDYTWAGFRCEISSRWFRVAGRWLTGDWDCFILVRGHGVWRPARLHSPALGGAGRPGFLEPRPGLQVRPTWVGRHLHVGVLRRPARLAAFHCGERAVSLRIGLDLTGLDPTVLDPTGLDLTGLDPTVLDPTGLDLTGAEQGVPAGAELVLARHGGRATRSFPATVTPAGAGRAEVRGEVPLADLAAPAAQSEPPAVTGPRPGDDGAAWDLYVKPAGQGRIPVTFPEDVAEARRRHGGREVAVERARYGTVVLAERLPRPVIESHAWDTAGSLLLQGSYLGDAAGLAAVLRCPDASMEHVLACDVSGGRFSVRVPAAAMPTFGRPLPLADGPWEVFARDGAGTVTRMACDHERLAGTSHRKVAAGAKLYAFTTAGYDAPVITAEPQLRLSEQGNFNRRVLRRAFYPIQARRPLRDAVLFVSWKGKQCTDNPRAIAEELRRRGDDREHIWVVTDYSADVPPGSSVVLSGTEEYFEALARCRYIVSNDDMQPEFRKRDGQVYLQTWHGTPLKKIGFDIGKPQFASGTAYFDHLAQDVAKWDLLLSQNPFSTPILRRAFRFGGEVCEYGYPRNDALSRGREGAAQLRERLSIPGGKRVLLYAPTWRDNQFYASGRYRFDLRLDLDRAARALGADHVLLIRGHHHLANDVRAGSQPGFARNVTAYPDITDLFTIADVVITDYSSVMFDFAVTGRPMLFFTYDLAAYRDKLRGFYFDFEAEAPGPLLATSEEVLAALADVDGVAASYRDSYQAFAAKYCPLDDGKAGARVCDRLFQG